MGRSNRKVYILRWLSPEGKPKTLRTDVPTPKNKREEPKLLAKAWDAARAHADRLLAEYLPPAESLDDHLDAYERNLRSIGRNPKHVAQAIRRCRKVFEDCGWRSFEDFSTSGFDTWLLGLKKPTKRNPKGLSNRTLNSYHESLTAFANWACRDERNGARRLKENPFRFMRSRSEHVDRRLVRRALSADEFDTLIKVAREGKPHETIDGPQRAMLYILASWTGLRLGELASLTRHQLRLDDNPPFVLLAAESSKRRKVDRLPLHEYAAEELRAWLASRPPAPTYRLGAPVFDLVLPSGYLRRMGRAINADLKAAKIPVVDARGYALDFHALRHTFVTLLARAGVPLSQAQQLARHSDPRLTANIYTDLRLADDYAALSRVPRPKPRRQG